MMNAYLTGSDDWWRVIRSMPWQEALQHLNDYKSDLLLDAVGSPTYVITGAKLHKVNAELKRINVATDHSRWYKAVKNTVDEETFQLILERKKELEKADK